VVKRQLLRASDRFKARQRDRGLASVLGALYLVRAGEFRPEMIDPQGDQALSMALDVIAATGDEGRSLALYHLRRGSLPEGAAARDVDEHVGALERFGRETEGKPGLTLAESTGMAERRAVSRALLEPSDEAQKQAVLAAQRWVNEAILFEQRYDQDPHAPLKREETVEALRGKRSGAATMAALFLRHGDAGGAALALESGPLRDVAPKGLVQRLDDAARRPDPEAWRELLEVFLRAQGRDDETSVDQGLLQAAAFGIGVEVYRRDPAAVDVAMHLAASLTAYGMAEVAPTVLAMAAKKHPEPPVLSAMLEAVATSMLREENSEDPASARRIFAAAAPVLEVADQLKGKVRPSAARVRQVAASIESRAGDLPRARTLLVASLKDEPSGEASRLLAEVERQSGQPQAALDRLREVIAAPEIQRDPVAQGEVHLLASDLQREVGARDKARDEATTALKQALDARQQRLGSLVVARAERLLARVLDRLGDDPGAARASERALVAARSDPRQLGLALLEALSRCYVAHDLAAARRSALHALGTQLHDDELVYVGLWLQLLEREMGARSDGTATKILESIEQGTDWSGRLAAWAVGKITDEALSAAARTAGQRTEATFYRALAQRAAGKNADESLRAVALAPALELIESQIARDLLAGNDRRVGQAPAGMP
jgi:tetratricopeptide (TPR) repeat protein